MKFIIFLSSEKRYSHHTIVAYKSDLNQFENFIKKDLLQVKVSDIRDYLKTLKNKFHFTNNTINRKLESLRTFYQYCFKHALIKRRICDGIVQLPASQTKTSYVTLEKLLPFFERFDPGNNKKHLRDFLIVELLYYTGYRTAELINVRKRNIDFANNRIKVIGKGMVERYLNLSDLLMELMKRYSKEWKIKTGNRFVFVNNRGKHIYPMYLWRLIQRVFPEKIIGQHVSPHTIRHSIATHIYQNGATMKQVRDFLGHRHFRSTNLYVHFDKETLKGIYERCHPRA